MDHETAPDVDAVVVGAGFAGLYMVKRLLDLGLNVLAYETADGVGGTWYWNRYPGARCDLESIDYSYSFSPELEQEWKWSERYATQEEIRSYLNHVADRFGLRPHIRLSTTVTEAIFDEVRDVWQVRTDGGEILTARFVIMASGVLSTPKPPEIEGLETFAGPTYHTGRWPHDGVDFTGQRVGLIGTGSSGVQSIPIIAAQADHLTVFQRTPNFTVPALHRHIDAEERAQIEDTLGERRELSRANRYGVPFVFPTRLALDADPTEREELYQHAWDESHLLAYRLTYADILTDEDANQTLVQFLHNKIRQIVKDSDTAERMLPRSFPFGTKRPCLGTAYYETFNRDDVTLVDVRESPIVRATTTGLETTAESYEFDSLVYATGWDAFTGAVMRIDVRGVGGLTLREKWAEGPHLWIGLATSKFPNMFFITGPGSPGPLSNMVFAIEQHVEWIGDCLRYLRDHQVTRIEAQAPAEDEWFEHVQATAAKTLYMRANSWYIGANVPGKPRVFNPYLAGLPVYREKCDSVVAAGYQGFDLKGGAPPLVRDAASAGASAG